MLRVLCAHLSLVAQSSTSSMSLPEPFEKKRPSKERERESLRVIRRANSHTNERASEWVEFFLGSSSLASWSAFFGAKRSDC